MILIMTYYKLFLSQTYKDSVIKHEEKMTSLEYLNETKSPIWLKSFYYKKWSTVRYSTVRVLKF